VISRRRALALLALGMPAIGGLRLAHAQTAPARSAAPAAPSWLSSGLQRDGVGALLSVFDLDPGVAAEVLMPATKDDALPDAYTPRDLVRVAGGQLLRALIVTDTRALIAEAANQGIEELYVGSGFRSQAYQEGVFAAQTQRWGDEETANRYSARPGHSQHQLGTTIDFTTSFRAFRGSDAAAWLADNAHRFGFVLPYTPASAPRTGYVDEPWHARWVGSELASQLQQMGYQTSSQVTADDALAEVFAAIA
jgi:D-alanyl-D-alanine carboxypeptidase